LIVNVYVLIAKFALIFLFAFSVTVAGFVELVRSPLQPVNVNPAFGVAVTVTVALESNVPPPLAVPPTNGFDDNVTVYNRIKFATNILFLAIVNVLFVSVDTMFTPSVQFVNLYPAFAVAVILTEALESNVPPPLAVPPADGIDDSVIVYIRIKFATNILFPAIVNV
jgi:hypothetical protein